MGDIEPYNIPAKPVTYKGIEMRSTLEATTAQALERIGVEFVYESRRYGSVDGLFTPDFLVESIAVVGQPTFNITPLYIEVRPEMIAEEWRKKNERDASILALSTDTPLIFVGLREYKPAALLGWCFGVRDDAVLAVIGQRRTLSLNGTSHIPEPCLYVGTAANIWVDGFNAAKAI